MRLRGPGPDLFLTYCTNVHRAETLAEVEAALDGTGRRLRARLGVRELGVGLHLSHAAIGELFEGRERLEAFRAFLESRGLFVFTLNAFPYGGFHGERVKEEVFRPTWAEPARVRYSLAAAAVLSRLLPPGARGSISTHTGSFRPWGDGPEDRRAFARSFAEVACALSRMEKATGREIVLALEPEPFSTAETTAEVLALFEGDLLGADDAALESAGGMGAREAREAMRRHLGVCLDTAHLAVQFEDLAASVAALRGAGLRIGKVQLSSALELRAPSSSGEGRARFLSFAEPRWLHQVVARGSGSERSRALDLDPSIVGEAGFREAEAWRAHVHVPVHLERVAGLWTTRPDLDAALDACVRARACDHFEIETYTWDVLPESPRRTEMGATLLDALEREFEYVLDRMRIHGYGPVP